MNESQLDALSAIAKKTELFGSRDRGVTSEQMKAIISKVEAGKSAARGAEAPSVLQQATRTYGL